MLRRRSPAPCPLQSGLHSWYSAERSGANVLFERDLGALANNLSPKSASNGRAIAMPRLAGPLDRAAFNMIARAKATSKRKIHPWNNFAMPACVAACVAMGAGMDRTCSQGGAVIK